MVRDHVLITPAADSCLPGITRAKVIELARKNDINVEIRRISPAELYMADEIFTTGTMGELSLVIEVDGRPIGNGNYPLTHQLQEVYKALTETEGVIIPRN